MATSGAARRRRLVQDKDARLDEERLRDLDDLATAEGQSPDWRIERFDQSDLAADLFGCGCEAPIVDQPAPATVCAEADILRDGKMRREAQLLLNDSDAETVRVARRQRSDGLAVDQKLVRCRASACPTAG